MVELRKDNRERGGGTFFLMYELRFVPVACLSVPHLTTTVEEQGRPIENGKVSRLI